MKNRYLFCILSVLFVHALFAHARANNMQLQGKAKLVEKNNTTGLAFINFQLQWDNSWRVSTPNNWDAAWLFVKFKHNETKWLHAHIDTNSHVHKAFADVAVEIKVGTSEVFIKGEKQTRGMGVFVYRKENGTGTLAFSDILLKWDYLTQLEENNVEYVDGPISLRVYAIEMVYVPQGQFYFGHNGTTGSDLTIHPDSAYVYTHAYNTANYGGLLAPYKGAMPLTYFSSPILGAAESTKWRSTPTYPNGYEGFYIMKYELSQHAYVDFLNSLTYEQQLQRAAGAKPDLDNYARFYTGNRNTVTVRLPGKSAPSTPALYGCRYATESILDWDVEYNGGNLAMSNLSWADCAAYLAWAGLRPLTELEYEKTCRGHNFPVKNEFAWGNPTKVETTTESPRNPYKPNESPTLSNANFIAQKGNLSNGTTECFPMRVGCLSFGSSTREQAGAAYYGVVNMSDNVSELYVNCNTKEGLFFDGAHGDGQLDGITALPNTVSTWPDFTTALGLGVRGVYGSATASAGTTAFVSDRANMHNTSVLNAIKNRYFSLGCRGGRTAPK